MVSADITLLTAVSKPDDDIHRLAVADIYDIPAVSL